MTADQTQPQHLEGETTELKRFYSVEKFVYDREDKLFVMHVGSTHVAKLFVAKLNGLATTPQHLNEGLRVELECAAEDLSDGADVDLIARRLRALAAALGSGEGKEQ